MEYCEPKCFEETLSLLSKLADGATVIAGGTDLLVDMRFRGRHPAYLVNINSLQELSYIRPVLRSRFIGEGEGLKLGSLTTIRALETSSLLKEKFASIAEAARQLGSPQIRNRATLGGNICRASPAAEMSPPLLTLEGRAVIASERGEREVELSQFFLGPGKTVLQSDEILKEIRIDPLPLNSGSNYVRLGFRGALDLAIVSVASFLSLDPGDGVVREARIALGATAPTPLRALKTEALLKGQVLTEELLAEASRTAAEEARPISDVRSSARYRKAMIAVLTRRSLESSKKAASRNGSGGDL